LKMLKRQRFRRAHLALLRRRFLQSIVLTLAVASRRRGRPEGYAIWSGVVYEGATAVCRQRTTS
jgi:hypothetical protein